jgi:uncharacterized ion transporter superfamily protein YfcC
MSAEHVEVIDDLPEEPEGKKGISFPNSLTILLIVTVLVWVLAFVVPPGQYQTDDAGAPMVGTYERIESPLTFSERVEDLFLAPVNGLYGIANPETGFIAPFGSGALFGAVGVFLFVLAMGAFMTMVFATGALELAIARLAHATRAQGWLLIVAIMAVFGILGSTMGFAEETLGFYGLLIPLALALGYDRMVAAGVIILGASIGSLASTVNPFSIGVASGEAGISIGDGIVLRLIIWVVMMGIGIAYVLRYAARVKKDPSRSIVGFSEHDRELAEAGAETAEPDRLTGKQKLVLVVTVLTFALLVFSVIPWSAILATDVGAADYYTHTTAVEPFWWELGWWFPELTALFLVAAILVGLVGGLGEKGIATNVAKGAGDFIGAGLVIVLARGVTVIMNNAQIIDTVLHTMETAVSGLSTGVFTAMVYLVNVPLAFLVPSSSGHATLAMPLLAPLADFANVDRSLIVTAWANGAGWLRLIAPTVVVVIGGLALAKVGYDKYLRFVAPLMAILLVANIVILLVAGAIL